MIDSGLFVRRLMLPFILPIACAWIARQERRILIAGAALGPAQLADARAIGLAHPECVRLLCVPSVPVPGGRLLRAVGRCTDAVPHQIAALSARYGIFIRAPFWGERRLLAHELSHTWQYERLGGVRPFLRRYLQECLTIGYAGAPLELEAIDIANRLCEMRT